MGSEFKYILGKVLGTQDCPTLRLASHHCVLYLNLIKSMFNTCILTHTLTSIHLSIQHDIIIPKQHTYLSIKQQETQPQIYTNPSIHLSWHLINLAYIYHSISYWSINPNMLSSYISSKAATCKYQRITLGTWRLCCSTKHIHACHQNMLSNSMHVHVNAWLTFTYLSVT